MMRSCARLLAASFLFLGSSASAQALPIEVDGGLNSLDLASRFEMLEDPTASMSFDAVRSATAFAPPADQRTNLGFSKSVWWVRFAVKNTTSHEVKVLLRQDYPLIDYLDLWVSTESDAWRHLQTGDQRPFASREFAHRDFVFSLDLPAGAERQVYLRFQTGGALDIKLTLYSQQALVEAISQEQLAYGVYYGGYLVLVFYNLFIFLAVKDRAFFYYLLYAISFGLHFGVHNGLSFQFLWPEHPDWGNQSLVVLLSLSLLFSLQFTRRFLDAGRNTPKLDVIAQGLQVLSAVPLVAAFFLPYSSLIVPTAQLTVLVTMIIMVLGGVSLVKGYRPARYFMLAWATLLVCVLAYMLKAFGWLPHNVFTQNGFQIGSLLEMALLSVALAARVKDIQQQSLTDPLTKLSNRRYFDQQLELEFARSRRTHEPLSLLIADIDHFKQFNDRYGHAKGDEILKLVARHLADRLGPHQVVCRHGGEEFAIILRGADGAEAMSVADSLRMSLENKISSGQPITISVGVAAHTGETFVNASQLFQAADSALYSAKEQGRNRVVLSVVGKPPPPSPEPTTISDRIERRKSS